MGKKLGQVQKSSTSKKESCTEEKCAPGPASGKKIVPKKKAFKAPAQGQRSGKKVKKIKKKNKVAKKAPAQGQKKMGSKRTISLSIYNKLWCFDLAVGQALKKCVEEKIL